MAPHPWRDDPTRKKPRPNRERDPSTRPGPAVTERSIPSFAYVQAYEAQLVYGRASEARQLYTPATGEHDTGAAGSRYGAGTGAGLGSQGQGGSLLRWAGGGADGGTEGAGVLADRYDIIHLLSSLPSSASSAGPSSHASRTTSHTHPRSPSPAASSSSWPDVDSDEEALFLISDDEELAAHRRAKQRKWMEKLRQDRLREMEAGERAGAGLHPKGTSTSTDGADVEESVLALMHHTALSIARSPNPIQLEAKILAHHAGDARFAFLRAQTSSSRGGAGAGGPKQSALGAAWTAAKRAARVELGLEKPPEAVEGVGMGLGGYESSDEEEDEEGREPSASPPPPPPSPPSPPEDAGDGSSENPNVRQAEMNDAMESTGGPALVPALDVLPRGEVVREGMNEAEAAKRAERKAKLEAWRAARKSGDGGGTG